MSDEPPVLRRLKELGLSQKEIAAKIGASPAAVSMWCTGKHPFEDPYRTEAEMLLAVMTGQATESSGPFTFRPTVFMNPGGTTRTGDTPMSPDAIAGLPK